MLSWQALALILLGGGVCYSLIRLARSAWLWKRLMSVCVRMLTRIESRGTRSLAVSGSDASPPAGEDRATVTRYSSSPWYGPTVSQERGGVMQTRAQAVTESTMWSRTVGSPALESQTRKDNREADDLGLVPQLGTLSAKDFDRIMRRSLDDLPS